MAKASKNEKPKDKKSLFNIKPELKHKLEFIVWKESAKQPERVTQTDIINKLLAEFIDKWEKKHGDIPEK
jgi:hypothetical protein